MIWTIELANYLEDAPWPAIKEELIDYAVRTGSPIEVIQNLQELEDGDEPYDSIEDIWQDYPQNDDFFTTKRMNKFLFEKNNLAQHFTAGFFIYKLNHIEKEN